MKNLKKAISLLLIALTLCTLLCACGGGSTKNVPAATISEAVNTAIGKADSLTNPPDSFITGYMKTEPSQFGDYVVCINAYGANIDEYGIFKAGENMDAAAVKKTVEDYLALRLASWMEEYMPEEKPKLTNAEIKTEGDYVMYCILSDEDKAKEFLNSPQAKAIIKRLMG